MILSDSARLCITTSSLSLFASSFASTQGVVSSMYLFVLWTTFQISSRAMLNFHSFIASSTLSAHVVASSFSSASGPSSFPAAGMMPPQYLSIIETVLETRFPRSFARSKFILLSITSLVKIPSCPNVYSLRRKYFRASIPYLSIRSTGSTTLPFDFDILPPSIRSQPCPFTCCGIGRSRLISIAGQMIVWNLTISFPTRW